MTAAIAVNEACRGTLLREELLEDVIWHVPGRNAIAGRYEGIEAVMGYFARRRDLASRTFRLLPVRWRSDTPSAPGILEETFYNSPSARRGRNSLREIGAVMQSATEVVLGVFSAVEERDEEKLFALCHDDVEFNDAPSLPYGGTTRGKAALRDRLTKSPETTWLGTWGPLQPTEAERRMDPRVVATAGEEVTVLYTQRAVSVQGERFEAPVLGLYGVRDGKLARAEMFHLDTAEILGFLERAGTGSRASAA